MVRPQAAVHEVLVFALPDLLDFHLEHGALLDFYLERGDLAVCSRRLRLIGSGHCWRC